MADIIRQEVMPKWRKIMKLILIVVIALISATSSAFGQKSVKQSDALEQEIRRLDAAEAVAVLNSDFKATDKLWAKDFTVNAPHNKIERAATGPIRTGKLKYSAFIREPETVMIQGDSAIVMGLEIVTPTADSPNAGTTMKRRYTNVWMKKNGEWRLTARHANNICQN